MPSASRPAAEGSVSALRPWSKRASPGAAGSRSAASAVHERPRMGRGRRAEGAEPDKDAQGDAPPATPTPPVTPQGAISGVGDPDAQGDEAQPATQTPTPR